MRTKFIENNDGDKLKCRRQSFKSLQSMIFRIKTNIILLVILNGILLSCRSDSGSVSEQINKYELDEGNLNSLSAFSTSFNISELKIKKLSPKSYEIFTLGNSDNAASTYSNHFNLLLRNNSVFLKAEFFNTTYSIEKILPPII